MKHTAFFSSFLTPFVLLLAFSWLANSACAATFSGPHQVKSYIVGGYGLHVELSPTPPQCLAHWEGTQFVLVRTHTDFKSIVASVLTAHNTGKSVYIWHNVQGDGTCGFSNQFEHRCDSSPIVLSFQTPFRVIAKGRIHRFTKGPL